MHANCLEPNRRLLRQTSKIVRRHYSGAQCRVCDNGVSHRCWHAFVALRREILLVLFGCVIGMQTMEHRAYRRPVVRPTYKIRTERKDALAECLEKVLDRLTQHACLEQAILSLRTLHIGS